MNHACEQSPGTEIPGLFVLIVADLNSCQTDSILKNCRYARIPCTMSALTISRGWLRWLNTIFLGYMPTLW